MKFGSKSVILFYFCFHVFCKPGAFSPRAVCDWSKASFIPEGPTMSVFNIF